MFILLIFSALLLGVDRIDHAPVPHFVTPCFSQPLSAVCHVERGDV